jgi:hypothetical protein
LGEKGRRAGQMQEGEGRRRERRREGAPAGEREMGKEYERRKKMMLTNETHMSLTGE